MLLLRFEEIVDINLSMRRADEANISIHFKNTAHELQEFLPLRQINAFIKSIYKKDKVASSYTACKSSLKSGFQCFSNFNSPSCANELLFSL
jgi:hypothetical protein